jgi:hypothetical protein
MNVNFDSALEASLPEYEESCSSCDCCNGFVYECEGEMCVTLGVCECFADKEYAGDDPSSPSMLAPSFSTTTTTSSSDEHLMMEAFNASLTSLLGSTGNDQQLLVAMQQQVQFYQQQQLQQLPQQQQQQQRFDGGFRSARGGRGRFIRGSGAEGGRGRGEGGAGTVSHHYYQPQPQKLQQQRGNQDVSSLNSSPWASSAAAAASSPHYTHIHRSGQPIQREYSESSSEFSKMQQSISTQQSKSNDNTNVQHVHSIKIGGGDGSGHKESLIMGATSTSLALQLKSASSSASLLNKATTSSADLANKISGGLDHSKVLVQRGPVGAVFIEDKKTSTRRRNKNKGIDEGLDAAISSTMEEKDVLPLALPKRKGGEDDDGIKAETETGNALLPPPPPPLLPSSLVADSAEISEEQRLKKDLRNAEKKLRAAVELQVRGQEGNALDNFQKSKVDQIPEIEVIVREIKEKLAAL